MTSERKLALHNTTGPGREAPRMGSAPTIVTSLTVLDIASYVGIVVVGTLPYDFLLKTPASAVLRALRDHGMAQKSFASLSLVVLGTL